MPRRRRSRSCRSPPYAHSAKRVGISAFASSAMTTGMTISAAAASGVSGRVKRDGRRAVGARDLDGADHRLRLAAVRDREGDVLRPQRRRRHALLMAVDIGADRQAEPEEAQLGVLGDARRAAALPVDVEPRCTWRWRRSRAATAAVSSCSRQFADRVRRRGSSPTWASWPASSSNTRSVLQIDRGDGERRREPHLEFAERGAADRAAETRDAGLADAGAARQIADASARRRPR